MGAKRAKLTAIKPRVRALFDSDFHSDFALWKFCLPTRRIWVRHFCHIPCWFGTAGAHIALRKALLRLAHFIAWPPLTEESTLFDQRANLARRNPLTRLKVMKSSTTPALSNSPSNFTDLVVVAMQMLALAVRNQERAVEIE